MREECHLFTTERASGVRARPICTARLAGGNTAADRSSTLPRCRPRYIRSDDSFATRLIYRILGAYGRPAQTWFFRKSIQRAAFGPQLESLLAWDIQRVCMSHGDVLDGNAHAVVADVLRPLRT